MATQVPNTQGQALPFNYANPNDAGEFLQQVKLEVGKQVMVSFLKDIPGMQSPPFVFCRVHWNSEMGENGRKFQCFGGQCCEQVTWQKGFGGQPGKFEKNKASKRYYIPVVAYETDPVNPTVPKATVKYIDMTWTAFNSLSSVIQQNVEGLDFFDRDIVIDVQSSGGPTTYVFNKRESLAMWKQNPMLKQQVEEQLPEVGLKLLNALPQMMTEEDFMKLKPQLDAKVQAAMQSHEQVQQAPQAQPYGAFPQAQPMQQAYPQSNVPQQNFTQSVPPVLNATVTNVQTMQTVGVDGMPVPGAPVQQPLFTQPQVNIPVQTQEVAQPAEQVQQSQEQLVQQTFELPKSALEFDPSALLK